MELNYRIAELIAMQERSEVERLEVRWRAEAEATTPKRNLLRECAASALVRVGMLLDHDAVERAALVARSASQ
jgi:hypothetical protein